MATVRPRGNSWEYIVKNKKLLSKPISITFKDKAEGDDYVTRLEAQLNAGIVPTGFAGHSHAEEYRALGHLILGYKQDVAIKPSDLALLNVLYARYGADPVRSLSYEWAEKLVAGMKARNKLKPSTIRHYVGALSRCFDWAVRKKIAGIVANPLKSLPKGFSAYSPKDIKAAGLEKKDESRDRRLSKEEEVRIREILAGAKPEGKQRPLSLKHSAELKLVFDLALETAMRMKEIWTLDVTQIDLEKRTIFLDKTKNGDKRQVPMSSVAHHLLSEFLRGFDGHRLFPWWLGSEDNLTQNKVTCLLSRQFSRIFDAAGCGDLRFHDLRHEATSRIYERTTLTDLQVSKITGHKDLKMLGRYTNLRGSDLAERLW